jgi:hypothetical protein
MLKMTEERGMSEANWTVGRVAQRTGVRVSALHFYEKKVL